MISFHFNPSNMSCPTLSQEENKSQVIFLAHYYYYVKWIRIWTFEKAVTNLNKWKYLHEIKALLVNRAINHPN